MLELSQSEPQPARAPEEPHVGAPPARARTKTGRGQRALWFFTAHYIFSVVLGLTIYEMFPSGNDTTWFEMLKDILFILTVLPVMMLVLAPQECIPIGLYCVTHGTLHLTKGATRAMSSSYVGWLMLAMYLLMIGIFIFAKQKRDRMIALAALAASYLLISIGIKAIFVMYKSVIT